MLPMRNAVSENILAKATTALNQNYAVIWLDHSEARVIHFNSEKSEVEVVRPSHPPGRLHVTADIGLDSHGTADAEFYRNVAGACDEVDAVLLAGHSIAKMEFVKYLHRHSPQTFDRISDMVTLPRLPDHLLLAEGRRFFDKNDHRARHSSLYYCRA